MTKYHKIFSTMIGLGFLVVLQVFSFPQPVFRFLIPVFLLFSFLVLAYNYVYLKNLDKLNFWVLVRPLMLLFSLFGIFMILPSPGFRSLFLIAAIVVIILSEIFLDNFSEQVLINETLIILFGLLVSMMAFVQFFPGYRFLAMFGVFLVIAFSARMFYEFVPTLASSKLIGSLILGLFSAQFFWGLGFLPFHFSATGLILFNLVYFSLILNYFYLFKTLNFKRLQFHLLLVVVASGIALASTPWRII